MTIRCHLTKEDYRAYQRRVLLHHRKHHWVFGAMLLLILALTWFGGEPEETVTQKIYLLVSATLVFTVVMAVMIVVLQLIYRMSRSRIEPTLGEHEFVITEDSLIETNADGRMEVRLGAIRCLDETSTHFLVLLRNGTAHLIPRRDLTSEQTEALRAFGRVVSVAATGRKAA